MVVGIVHLTFTLHSAFCCCFSSFLLTSIHSLSPNVLPVGKVVAFSPRSGSDRLPKDQGLWSLAFWLSVVVPQ